MDDKIRQHLFKDQKLADAFGQIEWNPAQEKNRDVYHDLMSSIVSQQLSTKVANVIFGRLKDRFGGDVPRSEELQLASIEELRTLGLSNQKAGYLKNIGAFFDENKLVREDWDKLSDDEIIRKLTAIKGVGVWTVQMILIFTLGRDDVFPELDLGIQQGIAKLYDLDEKGKPLMTRINLIAENWKPYRSHASRIIWRWKDTLKK